MKAVVVYESLWGSTAAVATAIAEGLGGNTMALTTAQATQETLTDADVIVAGAPAHMRSLPSEKSRANAQSRAEEGAEPEPDLSHPPLRDWLERLPAGSGHAAAFDTAHDAWWGGGAASKVAKGLKQAGYRRVVKPESFYVEDEGAGEGPFLREGELARARAWGETIARASAD